MRGRLNGNKAGTVSAAGDRKRGESAGSLWVTVYVKPHKVKHLPHTLMLTDGAVQPALMQLKGTDLMFDPGPAADTCWYQNMNKPPCVHRQQQVMTRDFLCLRG